MKNIVRKSKQTTRLFLTVTMSALVFAAGFMVTTPTPKADAASGYWIMTAYEHADFKGREYPFYSSTPCSSTNNVKIWYVSPRDVSSVRVNTASGCGRLGIMNTRTIKFTQTWCGSGNMSYVGDEYNDAAIELNAYYCR